jgi:hypothetical protein
MQSKTFIITVLSVFALSGYKVLIICTSITNSVLVSTAGLANPIPEGAMVDIVPVSEPNRNTWRIKHRLSPLNSLRSLMLLVPILGVFIGIAEQIAPHTPLDLSFFNVFQSQYKKLLDTFLSFCVNTTVLVNIPFYA